jgi:HPt (histidine-containing phosphotransfer) domain-containing protein
MTSRLTAGQRERLESLRRAYVNDLPARVRAIGEAAELLEPVDREKLQALYHLVHRLTGSSAIYGLTGLSRAASALEARVYSTLAGTAAFEPERGPSLADLVAALKNELAAATASSKPDEGDT